MGLLKLVYLVDQDQQSVVGFHIKMTVLALFDEFLFCQRTDGQSYELICPNTVDDAGVGTLMANKFPWPVLNSS